MRRLLQLFTLMACTTALSACGGGSGGGVGSTPAPTPTPTPTTPAFTSFANVQANTPTTISGITKEGTLTVDASGGIPSASVSTPTDGTGSVTFTVNSLRNITALTVAGAQSSVSFDSNSLGASIFVSGIPIATALSNQTGTNQTIYIDPYAVGFNYQSFGAWGTGLVAGSTARYGAISAGVATTASTIQTTGTATFRGIAAAIFTNPQGDGYRYGADALFNVNFASRSVGMTTNNDIVTNIATNITYRWTTPISGTMTYAAGTNAFAGILTSGSMTGNAAGRFYGPGAAELGGTFVIKGGLGAMVGGFGGKQ